MRDSQKRRCFEQDMGDCFGDYDSFAQTRMVASVEGGWLWLENGGTQVTLWKGDFFWAFVRLMRCADAPADFLSLLC